MLALHSEQLCCSFTAGYARSLQNTKVFCSLLKCINNHKRMLALHFKLLAICSLQDVISFTASIYACSLFIIPHCKILKILFTIQSSVIIFPYISIIWFVFKLNISFVIGVFLNCFFRANSYRDICFW